MRDANVIDLLTERFLDALDDLAVANGLAPAGGEDDGQMSLVADENEGEVRSPAPEIAATAWELAAIQKPKIEECGMGSLFRDIELPLIREDLETDIRAFSEERSLDPAGWIKRLRKREQQAFPEPVFGGWRYELEKAVLRLHREHPADLLLASYEDL